MSKVKDIKFDFVAPKYIAKITFKATNDDGTLVTFYRMRAYESKPTKKKVIDDYTNHFDWTVWSLPRIPGSSELALGYSKPIVLSVSITEFSKM